MLPFAVEPLDLRGRIARLGPALDAILTRHAYPEPVARLLGEAAALTVLLGTALKSEGRFQLQTRTDGVVDMLVVDFDAPDRLRAFARFDAARLRELPASGAIVRRRCSGAAISRFTIEQGAEVARYQGVAPIEGGVARTGGADLFPAVRANSDLHPARGGAGRDAGGLELARGRPAGAIPAAFAGAPAPWPISARRRAGRPCRA